MTDRQSRIRWTPELLGKLRELLAQGLTWQEIADAMGLRKAQVGAAIAKRGWGGRGSRQLTPAVFAHALNIVARTHGVASYEVGGRRRFKPLVHARQHVMWVLRQKGYSWFQIAAPWGMDHTSCMWGVAQHERRLRAEAADDARAWDRVGHIHTPAFDHPQCSRSVHRAARANSGSVAA
jgi:hypothetical protein